MNLNKGDYKVDLIPKKLLYHTYILVENNNITVRTEQNSLFYFEFTALFQVHVRSVMFPMLHHPLPVSRLTRHIFPETSTLLHAKQYIVVPYISPVCMTQVLSLSLPSVIKTVIKLQVQESLPNPSHAVLRTINSTWNRSDQFNSVNQRLLEYSLLLRHLLNSTVSSFIL